MPPSTDTSSPMMKTRGSRAISSARASFRASASFRSRHPPAPGTPISGIDVFHQSLCGGFRTRAREFHGRFQNGAGLLLQVSDAVTEAALGETPAQKQQRIAFQP